MKRESLDHLCLNCPLPDCDEESPACLIQIERRKNPAVVKRERQHGYEVTHRENVHRRTQERLKQKQGGSIDLEVLKRCAPPSLAKALADVN